MTAPSEGTVGTVGTVRRTSRTRAPALDGIRGVAIILVVLSHGWALWPMDNIRATVLVNEVFTSGNLAVSIFFVVGGYLATRSMLAAVDVHGRPGPRAMVTRVVRRAVRTGAHSYTLMAFVMFAAVLDVSEQYPEEVTRTSVRHVMTFTFNWLVRNNAYEARPDLGHLWYICVDLQVFIILVLLVRFLGHRRVALLATLLGIIVAVTLWRAHVVDSETPIDAWLRTTTRMDAMIWGAALATALPYLQWLSRRASAITWLAVVLLLAMLFTTGNSDDYYRQDGVLISLGATLFVLGASFGVTSAPLRALGWAPLRALGARSMPIYIWHYTIFFAVARWNVYFDWQLNWVGRAALALTLTAVFAVGAQVLVERPLQRWLAHPHWNRPAHKSGRHAT